jgi:phosphoribosylamine-glycine ligase
MNKIINDLFSLKVDILSEVSRHLSAETAEKLNRLEYDIMETLNEVTKEYLDKTEKPKEKDQGQIKKVVVE